MNFVRRALCSVTRKKGKSFILFAVIFVLGNVIAGAIAIKQSTQNVETNVKKQLGGMATIEFDVENNQDELMNSGGFPETLSIDLIKKIGESPYVKYYDYNTFSGVQTKDLKVVSAESDYFGGMDYLSLKGVNYPKLIDLEEKKIELVEGTVFSQSDIDEGKNVGIISSKLADENGLSVGDQMIIDNRGIDYQQDGTSEEIFKIDVPIEIIGIFEPTTVEMKSNDKNNNENSNTQQQLMSLEELNTVYLPNSVVVETNKTYLENMREKASDTSLYGDGSEQDYYVPVYVLKSPDDVEAFKQETQPLLPQTYKVNASSDQYEKIGASMKNLSQIASYVVVIAVLATLLIISLVVLLFMRDRKHELGIYLSLGDKRGHVMGQIIIEMILISGLALLLSLITGNYLGKVVSESLLTSNVLSSAGNQMEQMYYSVMDVTSTLTSEDILSVYHVTFSLGYVVTYLVVGMGTVLVSAILPLVYIVRLNPKKIMM